MDASEAVHQERTTQPDRRDSPGVAGGCYVTPAGWSSLDARPHWHPHTSCLKYTVPIKYSFFPPTGVGKVTAGTYRKGYPLPLNHSFPLGGPLTRQWTNGSPHHDHGHDEGSACPPQHHRRKNRPECRPEPVRVALRFDCVAVTRLQSQCICLIPDLSSHIR